MANTSTLLTEPLTLGPTTNAVRPKNDSRTVGGSGVFKEVALKVISKKKVKGNDASVWGEMEVLKGLNHPNIVGGVFNLLPFHGALLLSINSTIALPFFRSSFMNVSSPDQNIIFRSNSLWVGSSSSAYCKRVSSRRVTL